MSNTAKIPEEDLKKLIRFGYNQNNTSKENREYESLRSKYKITSEEAAGELARRRKEVKPV